MLFIRPDHRVLLEGRKNAPIRAEVGADSFGKSKEHISANLALGNRHRYAGNAFIEFSLVFKPILKHFYFYLLSTVSFADNTSRRRDA